MHNAIIIRDAQPADASAIAHVHQAVWHDEAGDPAWIAALIGNDQRHTAVATHGEAVIGFADGFITNSLDGVRRWELDLIAVLPQYHRQGVASALVSAMNAAACDNGATVARALTHQTNVAIHRTLHRAGYASLEPGLCLYIATAEPSAETDLPTASHLIPVDTLSYAGVWLEGDPAPSSLRLARHRAAIAGRSIAGVLIADTASDAHDDAQSAGYTLVGQYMWWSLPLDERAAM